MRPKELFSRLAKGKLWETPMPIEAKNYRPIQFPADAPTCWEKRWGKDMVTISDPEGTCTLQLYGPLAKKGPRSHMLARATLTDCKTHSAVYTSRGFGGWFVVGLCKTPWDPAKTKLIHLVTGPLLSAAIGNCLYFLDLPDRMKNARKFRFGEFLGIIDFGDAAPNGFDNAETVTVSFSIDRKWYIDHIFCTSKGEYAWKLECVIPVKDLGSGSKICELPHYIFSTLSPNVPPKREDQTRDLPDSGEIFGRDAIHISKNLAPLPPLEDGKKPLPPYLAHPNDPFSEKHFGSEMLQIRNDSCHYTVQLYGSAAGTAPISRWLPHEHFDIRLDMFSSGEGESWYLITTIRSKDGTSSRSGNLSGRDWYAGTGHTPNVELLLPERFRESSFFALSGKNLPLDVRFAQRIQCSQASPVCFAFQMDRKMYKDYLLEIHKGGYIWVLECIIPSQQGSTKPIPTEFVPPGYMFGSFMPLI